MQRLATRKLEPVILPVPSPLLGFEATSLPSQVATFVCQTCDRLKPEMSHADSFVTHASAADRLLAHLTMTWKCREQYWNTRSASCSQQELLCIKVDGYDRSKPCLPRWSQGRPPKGGAFDAWQSIQPSIRSLFLLFNLEW